MVVVKLVEIGGRVAQLLLFLLLMLFTLNYLFQQFYISSNIIRYAGAAGGGWVIVVLIGPHC